MPASGDVPAESAALTLSVASTDIEGVVLTTGTGGSMSGRVVFDGNVAAPQPATQFRVVARPVNRDGPNTGAPSPDNGRLRQDWGFTLTAVMGANRIGIATLPPGWAIKSIDAQGRDLTDAPVEFSGGEEYEDVVITLTNRFPTLTGTTTDRKAAPGRGDGDPVCRRPVEVGGGFADGPHREIRQSRYVQADRIAARRLPGDRARISASTATGTIPSSSSRCAKRPSRVTLREGEGGTLALQLKSRS